MTAASLAVQFLNGLANASTLFLLACGLSLIFGVTRIVNFAHGSLYMLGAYVAWSLTQHLSGGVGFWASMFGAAVAVAALGALIESALLRRLYRSPELLQLLATFALTLIIRDAVLYIWGPEDLLGPRAPGLAGSINILGRAFPQYDVVLIVVGPLVLLALHVLLTRTRWGAMVRAATQDRDMAAAVGVNQAILFTSVFALGSGLAGLAGALQLPREPASASLDLFAIGDAFVVVVVGGMGSIPGAFVAALIIAEIKALCIALGSVDLPLLGTVAFPKFTLVAEFIVMAVVLIVRPWGLFGQPQSIQRALNPAEPPSHAAPRWFYWLAGALCFALAVAPLALGETSYALVLAIDIFIAILFAASLYSLVGPGGMHSFGHAAYFGLGAYAAALLLKSAGAPMPVALALSPLGGALGALLFGWFCVRLSGVYFAMLTLAFSQIVWSIAYQWDAVTGGSNGLIGVWPSQWLASHTAYYWLSLALCVAGLVFLRIIHLSPFGAALRAARDNPLRAEAIGIDRRSVQWRAFTIAGAVGGLAGGLFAFSKGSISPETLSVSRSIDGLVMVLFGGVESALGPIVGAAGFVALQDTIARHVDYWRAMLGFFMLALTLLFPGGLAGVWRRRS
ncbi:MAG: ABC transporter permease [Hyphomicrobiales bacterium]|nr:ABC transporter permease [Hyphomicrobiales bacterium]